MITDSIAKASIPMPPSKDLSKKKRGNRTAKLKQCKLDARREQWLLQVKKSGCKEEKVQSLHLGDEGKTRVLKKLEIDPREGQIGEPVHSDLDSPSHSPSSHVSSILGSNMSGTNFTASCSSGSSSSGSFSGSVFGEEEDADEDGCLDDWETIADALAASDDKPKLELPLTNQAHELENCSIELTKPKQEQRAVPSSRAWKPDDAFRPQYLPNLAKQNSFPLRKNYGCGGGSVWACKSVVSAPTSCPICCEDLDLTDSSFHPCGCGFRLCLFCHKRILEEDGRCPGCRKPYETTAFHLARSCSIVTRF